MANVKMNYLNNFTYVNWDCYFHLLDRSKLIYDVKKLLLKFSVNYNGIFTIVMVARHPEELLNLTRVHDSLCHDALKEGHVFFAENFPLGIPVHWRHLGSWSCLKTLTEIWMWSFSDCFWRQCLLFSYFYDFISAESNIAKCLVQRKRWVCKTIKRGPFRYLFCIVLYDFTQAIKWKWIKSLIFKLLLISAIMTVNRI